MSYVNTKDFDFGDWEAMEDFNFQCPVCEGEEEVEGECPECGGEGSVFCDECDGEDEECLECDDDGKVLCIECIGEGVVYETCEHCADDPGYIYPIWNTAWEINISVDQETKAEVAANSNCIVFEDDNGDSWLGLTGCGMDMTPSLCKAWLMLGFGWIPDNWLYKLSRNGKSYCVSCVGEEWTKKIFSTAIETVEHNIASLQRTLRDFGSEPPL